MVVALVVGWELVWSWLVDTELDSLALGDPGGIDPLGVDELLSPGDVWPDELKPDTVLGVDELLPPGDVWPDELKPDTVLGVDELLPPGDVWPDELKPDTVLPVWLWLGLCEFPIDDELDDPCDVTATDVVVVLSSRVTAAFWQSDPK
jgi:hypothetical protein